MWRADSLEKTLMLGKIEGGRRRGSQRMRYLFDIIIQWAWVWANWEIVKDREAWCASVHGMRRARHNLETAVQHQHCSVIIAVSMLGRIPGSCWGANAKRSRQHTHATATAEITELGTGFPVVTISQYMNLSTHQFVHVKLTLCVNHTSILS